MTIIQSILVYKSPSPSTPRGIWVRDDVPFTDEELSNIFNKEFVYTLEDGSIHVCGQYIKGVSWDYLTNSLRNIMIYKTDEDTWKQLVGLVVVEHAAFINLEA